MAPLLLKISGILFSPARVNPVKKYFMKPFFTLAILLLTLRPLSAQLTLRPAHALLITIAQAEKESPVYEYKPAVDLPVTAATAGWTLYAFSKIYSKESSSEARIRALNRNDINGFDRSAAGRFSQKAADASNLFFFGSIPMPLLLLADKHIRGDAGKVGLLYAETMSVTGLLYTSATYFADRYRPLTYNQSLPLSERISGNNRNSFFAGHVALVGGSTFFAAKVFSDYHPHSSLRFAFWGLAAGATAATGYLRYRAGKHFPSDVLLGAAAGALSGILVPQFHKARLVRNQNFTLLPFAGPGNGLAIVYHIK